MMNSVLSLEIIGSEYLCWQEPSAKKILIENTCKPYSLKNVNTPKSVVSFVFHFVLEYRGYIFHKAYNYQQGRIQDLWLGGGAWVGEGPQLVQGRTLVGGPGGQSPPEALGILGITDIYLNDNFEPTTPFL